MVWTRVVAVGIEGIRDKFRMTRFAACWIRCGIRVKRGKLS